jgi:hypothetical protein
MIRIPLEFNEVWKMAKCTNFSSKVLSSGKFCDVSLSLSDENMMFYAYKIAETFGFAKPTDVLIEYMIENNIFYMLVLEDASSQESGTGPEMKCISSDDEQDSDEHAIEVEL